MAKGGAPRFGPLGARTEFKSASDLFGCRRLCCGRVLALFDLE